MAGWDDDVVVSAVNANADVDDSDVLDEWDKEEEVEEVKPVVAKPTAKKAPEPAKVVPRDLSKAEQDVAVKMADLKNAMDLFGIEEGAVDTREILNTTALKKTSLPATAMPAPAVMEEGLYVARLPQTLPEAEMLAKKVGGQMVIRLGNSPFYFGFLENLLRHTLNDREAADIRKLATVLNDLAAAKQKKSSQKKAVSLPGAKKSGNKLYEDDDDFEDDYDD